MVQGNFAEALANSQSIRELHVQRPSGVWTDRDLLVYEALIYIRMGDTSAAEQILYDASDNEEHSLTQLARAELLLLKGQPDEAESHLKTLISQYPNGILAEPLMNVRALLAKALFDGHKIHEALQVMKDALRVAATEQFYRPFLESNAICSPLLSLALQAEHLTSEARVFVKELLRLSKHTGTEAQFTKAEIHALSASASISPREQEVLRLLSAGYSNREMATKLSISESTVKTHIANIYGKLNVSGRIQAVTYAKELKLV